MFKTILATAAAILTAAAVAAPAQADGSWYGKFPNGVSLNGRQLQGINFQGVEMNGWSKNGQKVNGQRFNGAAPAATTFVLEAIELPPQEL